jgi:hypothetical protein
MDTVADVSPGNGEWPHFPGETPRGERRTLSADEVRYMLEVLEVDGERFEVEHRWDG